MNIESIVRKSYTLSKDEAIRIMDYRYLKGECIELVEVYTIDIKGLERYYTIGLWFLKEGVYVMLYVETINTIMALARCTRIHDTVIEEYMAEVFKDRIAPQEYDPTYHDLVIQDNLLQLVNNGDTDIAYNILVHYLRMVVNKVITPKYAYLIKPRSRRIVIDNYVFVYKNLASLYLKLCQYYGTEVFKFESSTLRVMMNMFIHNRGGRHVKMVRC
jgi:hypothetical protein